jgi:hypothetical protein
MVPNQISDFCNEDEASMIHLFDAPDLGIAENKEDLDIRPVDPVTKSPWSKSKTSKDEVEDPNLFVSHNGSDYYNSAILFPEDNISPDRPFNPMVQLLVYIEDEDQVLMLGTELPMIRVSKNTVSSLWSRPSHRPGRSQGRASLHELSQSK